MGMKRVGGCTHGIGGMGWCRLVRKQCARRVCGVERERGLRVLLNGYVHEGMGYGHEG